MERSQYIISGSSKQEKSIWVCGKCKKAHIEAVLLGRWKLIDRKDDDSIPCDVCGAGLSKVETVEPLAARKVNFISRFS